ncbi:MULTISPECIES: winged helix-turn-helix domain-containing protein [Rhodomicrobium]|uniref:ATP-binding protein n=1 Tax=Rhodomicrobium TaxID=1068 RepID=UPI000B4B555D|nr:MULTISPECIES: winged helix-turn-helix domain-containing protein [Rhodomicrobium]
MTAQALKFGPFQLMPAQRMLLQNGKPLAVGGRALDILIALAERPGDVLGRDELVARVWPNVHVAEANLRVHVAALRKALGDGQGGNRYITNVAGRGYCLVAPVTRLDGTADSPPAPEGEMPRPSLLVRMIGRDDVLQSLETKLPQRRFITIVGPGGIGKTTLALTLADRLAASYGDGVAFADLAALADASLVPAAVVSGLGLSSGTQELTAAILSFLRERRTLLLLDNCEHVIDAAATLAEAIYQNAAGVHILATSREPLRAEGEWVQRLSSLPAPASHASLTAAEALAYPAVQLLVERAMASVHAFELRDADVPLAAELCRKLDGNPLAIELAAARLEQFGIAGLVERLDDRFSLLSRGRRTALPRHKTLRAMLDWSHDLLGETDRAVLRRFSIFKSLFTLESAIAIAADDEIGEAQMLDVISNLTMKSLLTVDLAGENVCYRLLDTTRAYAAEKLTESGERDAIALRHARRCCIMLAKAERDWPEQPVSRWLAIYGRRIDDVRAALDWCFGPTGDTAIGIGLTIASSPLWFQLSYMDEYLARIEWALEQAGKLQMLDPDREMRLRIEHGHALWHAKGPGPEMEAAFGRALELAEDLASPAHQLEALWGLWTVRNAGGDYPATLALAQRFRAIAILSGDDKHRMISDRNLAISHHFLGNHALALEHANAAQGFPDATMRRSRNVGFQLDQQFAVRTLICRILWVHGLPDQAARCAQDCVEQALAAGHSLSLCYALAIGACPVAIWSGDLPEARRLTTLLDDCARRRSLIYWQRWGWCFASALALAERDAGVPERPVPLPACDGNLIPRQLETMATLHEALTDPAVIANVARGNAGWCAPEILRVQGLAALTQASPEAACGAEALFRRSLDLARRQQALSWELRTAVSLTRLLRDLGRDSEALDCLTSVHSRFTEGFATADLQKASRLLADLTACGQPRP